MPTRKPRRTPKPARPLTVPIVDLETTQLRSLLGLEDDSGASAVLSELSRFLDHWASALVNIPNVGLRSDFISHAEPLAKRAESFWNVVMRADPALLSLAEYCGFVSVHALEAQLRGFGLTAEWIKLRKPTSIGIVTGCVAGLATITPAAGFVGPAAAMAMGAGGGLVCFAVTVFVKQRLKIDDSLDVFAVHGVGGIAGTLALSAAALPVLGGVGFAAGDGWLRQLGIQALGVAAAGLWSGAATYLIVKAIGAVTALRVGPQEEYEGLDISIHGERAYEYE